MRHLPCTRLPFASRRIPESWTGIVLLSCPKEFQYAEYELDELGASIDESRTALKRLLKIEVPRLGKNEEAPMTPVFMKGKNTARRGGCYAAASQQLHR